MDEDRFEEILSVAEIRLQGKFGLDFKNQLYEFFKRDNEATLELVCRAVGALAVPAHKVRFEDFTREAGRVHAPARTLEDSLKEALLREEARAAKHKAADESWKKTPEQIMKEQAAAGNAFAAQLLEDRRKKEARE